VYRAYADLRCCRRRRAPGATAIDRAEIGRISAFSHQGSECGRETIQEAELTAGDRGELDSDDTPEASAGAGQKAAGASHLTIAAESGACQSRILV
jgi:hypothetical protein